MPEVSAWAIAAEDHDIIDLDIRGGEVGLTLRPESYSDETFVLLTPRQARMLSRDLAAAARAAEAK